MSATGESRFGCFGCAWVIALLSGTLFLVGALLWISPKWMERIQFWKEPVLADRVVFLPAGDEDTTGLPEPLPQITQGPVLWREKAVRADYTTTGGATLTTIEGAVFTVPSGAVDRNVEVEVVPVVNLPTELIPANHLQVGPMHDLRVDGQDHWQFDRPISVSLPYLSEMVNQAPAGTSPVIATLVDDYWEALPTEVDAAKGVVTAQTDHASILSTFIITTALGTTLKFSETGQGLWLCMTKHLDSTYKTKNFAIHYDTSGEHAVVSDTTYPITNGRSSGEHPLYVVDVGKYLEEMRTALPKVGMKVAEAGRGTRWDVFLLDLTAFGNAEIGGPILFDRELKIPNRNPGAKGEIFPPPDQYHYLVRKTCAHELMHVAQDDYYNWTNAGDAKSWTETSAEYQAVRLLELLGYPDKMPHYYIKDEPNLLSVPWYHAHLSEGDQEYAYAEFIQWLEKKGLDTKFFINSVNTSANPTLTQINTSLSSALANETLPELFLGFAEDMHHSGLWNEDVVPLEVSKAWWRQAGTPFGRLSWQSRNRAEATVNTYDDERVQLPALTTNIFHLRADVLPPLRQAKLVIGVETKENLVGHKIGVAQYYNIAEPPLTEKAPRVEWFSLPGGGFSKVLDKRIVAPAIETTDSNRTTLFLANTSLETNGPSLSVARWLLMAPEYIQYQRFQSGRYQIVWHKAELKDDKAGGKSVFAGYNVYCKRVDQEDFPSDPINSEPVTTEIYFDDTAGPHRWDYTTTVVDIYGNESEPAVFKLEGDPFEGTWEGKTRLIRGTVSEPIIKVIKAEIAQNAAPGDNLGQVNNLINKAGVVLKNLDLLFRFGVSMTWEIKLKSGNLYSVTPIAVFGRPLDNPESLEMERIGAFALAPRIEGKTYKKGTIQLYRENEIRQTFEGTYNDPTIGSGEIGVRLAFKRKTAPAFDSNEFSQ